MNNASDLEEIGETQTEPSDRTIAAASSAEPVSQPEKPVKRTVSGITRNILATQVLIESTQRKIDAHCGDSAWDRDGDTIRSLRKQLANLGQRMEQLKRLRDKEQKYDDR